MNNSQALGELQQYKQWIIWGEGQDGGKLPKNPRTGGVINAHDNTYWSDFHKALTSANIHKCPGPAFVLSDSDPFTGIDLDECLTASGDITPQALEIIQKLDSYSEITPSGKGVRVWVRGKFDGPGKTPNKLGDGSAIEMYCRGRYFTFTGNHLPGAPKEIRARQDVIDELLKTYWQPKPNGKAPHAPELETDGTVSEGNRHKYLVRLAGALRRQGLGYAEILGSLKVFNTAKCDPPKDESELEKMAASVCRYKPGQVIVVDEEPPPERPRVGDAYEGPDPMPESERNRSQAKTFTPPAHWQRLDVAKVSEWDCPPLVPVIDGMIAKGNFVFVAAQSQTGKTLLWLYIARMLVTGGKLFGQYDVTKVDKVLYLLLEDPGRRAKERLSETLREFPDFPEGKFIVQVAPGFKLTDPAMFEWLKKTIKDEGYDFVIIDTYQKATPGITSFDDEKQSVILHSLAALTRETSATLTALDHVRKQDNGRKRQLLSLDDIKGTGGKSQNADCVMLIEKHGKNEDNQWKLQCMSKDFDKRVGILLKVAPMGYTEGMKFTYLGELSEMASKSATKAAESRQTTLEKMIPEQRYSKADLAKLTGLKALTAFRQMEKLYEEGKVGREGENRDRRYWRTVSPM